MRPQTKLNFKPIHSHNERTYVLSNNYVMIYRKSITKLQAHNYIQPAMPLHYRERSLPPAVENNSMLI